MRKTTVDLAEPLLEEARRLAAREGVTLKAVIERGLRRVIADAAASGAARFRLRPASFKGKGLQPDAHGATWAELRDRAYEGRGG
ncbi:MAG: DUF2191 domain-containing protein [Alphaproteobacteria bacterium]|nr:DUF2191 domain-containing protein [Alphaproteobacteria bacterium]